MVDFASVITLALVLMDLVAHYVKIEHVRFIVKMGESAPCQEINANVEMVSMDLGATKGKSLISYRLFLLVWLNGALIQQIIIIFLTITGYAKRMYLSWNPTVNCISELLMLNIILFVAKRINLARNLDLNIVPLSKLYKGQLLFASQISWERSRSHHTLYFWK